MPTSRGTDQGIDVESRTAVGQVKLWTSRKVGHPDLQMLQGASRGRRMLFFSYSGYSQPAYEWAERDGIELFVFDAAGVVTAVNIHADSIVRSTAVLGSPLSECQKMTA